MMFDKWYLERAFTECPNENCGYCGHLEQFVDLDSDDYPIDREFVLNGKCPKCGEYVRLCIEPHVEFYVSEELQTPRKAHICPHYQGVCGLDDDILCYCSSSYEMCDKYKEET